MKLISIDSSTTSTGYAIYIDGELINSSSINLSKIKNSDERLKEMMLQINKLIRDESPDIVVTELTVVTRNPQAQRILSELLGGIMMSCYLKNVEYISLRPTEWRKFVKDEDEKIPRKREELKAWSINKVQSIFNMPVDIDDISDAILIGYGYITYCNNHA